MQNPDSYLLVFAQAPRSLKQIILTNYWGLFFLNWKLKFPRVGLEAFFMITSRTVVVLIHLYLQLSSRPMQSRQLRNSDCPTLQTWAIIRTRKAMKCLQSISTFNGFISCIKFYTKWSQQVSKPDRTTRLLTVYTLSRDDWQTAGRTL